MWASIKGKYKDVAKPDISGNVKTYDTDVAKAADLAKTKKELVPDSFNVWASDNEAKGKEINSHLTEVESLHDKFSSSWTTTRCRVISKRSPIGRSTSSTPSTAA
jgi:hypothetical protein